MRLFFCCFSARLARLSGICIRLQRLIEAGLIMRGSPRLAGVFFLQIRFFQAQDGL